MCINPPKDPIEITAEQAKILISKVKKNKLDKDDQRILCQIIQMVVWLQLALRETKISLNRVKKLVFGQKSEKNTAHNAQGSSSNNNVSPEEKCLTRR